MKFKPARGAQDFPDLLRHGAECFRSRPGTLLLVSTVSVIGMTLALPYLPISVVFGFVPLPASLMLTMLGLTALYVLVAECAKKYFYSRMEHVNA